MENSDTLLRDLKNRRKLIKASITRIENFVADPINLGSSPEMFAARRDRLTNIFKEYEEVQLNILSYDDKDVEDVGIIEDRYFNVMSKITSILKKLTQTDSMCTNVSNSKLPNIEIPSYDGRDFTKFKPFIDLFLAVIHNNSSLSDVQKLFYLRKSLTHDALSVIENLPLVNQSYKEALELLNKRFDNEARLISNHINIILELPCMQKGTAAAIRSFISGVQQQMYALKNLGQPVQHWDMLLISILTKKLDQYTNRAFQLDRDPNTLPTMVDFISFLERRAMALEDSGDKSSTITSNKSPTAHNKVSNIATTSNKSNKLCLFCQGTGHAIHGCPRFKLAALEDRLRATIRFCTKIIVLMRIMRNL
ncbi:uncharacterized protein LOC131844899 [Achroia grisella]|uniref:uncharacterized protein LOC131844899 n=1 Tax=Achroia grisella TaxID=688607 RepID=UPI0027D27815|nr:uncharacterized protein LOC131844899 [Achroia grisella]